MPGHGFVACFPIAADVWRLKSHTGDRPCSTTSKQPNQFAQKTGRYLGFLAPIILALLINQIGNAKVKGFVQTITYMPHFISTVVMVSMINIFLAPQTGILGRFFGQTSLMGNPNAFTPIYWISEVWQHMGWNCIIYLAALSSVDMAL